MEAVLTKLAEQLPVAVLFALFVLYWTDRMQKAQDKRDEMLRQVIDKVVAALTDHDHKTDVAIAAMFERTSKRPSRRQPRPGAGERE